MRPIPKFFITALIAFCWSSLASADPHSPGRSIEPSRFAKITNLQLDAAFESFVSRGNRVVLYGLAGPSTMDCSSKAVSAGLETCVVTSSGPPISMPAALAQH